MSPDPNKKTPRSFQCRESLWQKFEQMARELECSVDYLINDAMKQYARQRGYSGATRPSDASPPPSMVSGAMSPGRSHGAGAMSEPTHGSGAHPSPGGSGPHQSPTGSGTHANPARSATAAGLPAHPVAASGAAARGKAVHARHPCQLHRLPHPQRLGPSELYRHRHWLPRRHCREPCQSHHQHLHRCRVGWYRHHRWQERGLRQDHNQSGSGRGL